MEKNLLITESADYFKTLLKKEPFFLKNQENIAFEKGNTHFKIKLLNVDQFAEVKKLEKQNNEINNNEKINATSNSF